MYSHNLHYVKLAANRKTSGAMPQKNRFYPLSSLLYLPYLRDAEFPARAVDIGFMPYDLFGEIPVTEDDLIAWVAAVAPRWLYPERSFHGYVKAWNIADKVRSAKLAGTFHQVVEKPRNAWHARLSLDAVI